MLNEITNMLETRQIYKKEWPEHQFYEKGTAYSFVEAVSLLNILTHEQANVASDQRIENLLDVERFRPVSEHRNNSGPAGVPNIPVSNSQNLMEEVPASSHVQNNLREEQESLVLPSLQDFNGKL